MFELKDNQNVFIELTNSVHGGLDWEFGTCLWSPEKSKNEGDTWKTMRDVKEGDIIIHSLKTSRGHIFQGMSLAKSNCEVLDFEPPRPGAWGGRETYYKIGLKSYYDFNKKIKVKIFLDNYKNELGSFDKSFYTNKFEVAQKYLVKVQREIFDLLIDFFKNESVNVLEICDLLKKPNDNSDNSEKKERTKRSYEVNRVIRDPKIVKELKEKYNNVCQICGKTIIKQLEKKTIKMVDETEIVTVVHNETRYSEAHHIVPISDAHKGEDEKDNLIILCPTHHAEFDYGCIAIKPKTNKIEHIDKNNEYHGKNLSYRRPDINEDYLRYHYERIFGK